MKYALALALSLLAATVLADSWPAAKVAGVASPTGQVVVRVVPGMNLDATYGFSGAQKGAAATAVFYRLDPAANYVKYREISLLNPIAPVFAAVSDSGELVTLDNWHNMGLGDSVVVVYSPEGTVRRSYRLNDIYAESEIKAFDRSTSSIWWRCPSPPIFEPRTSALELMDAVGANVEISLKTGAVKRNPTSQKGC
jgi:hypothetical protein